MRDILVTNLSAAETTIKSQMSEIAILKKQSASDNEVITLLPLTKFFRLEIVLIFNR
jgi:hypothetical protein